MVRVRTNGRETEEDEDTGTTTPAHTLIVEDTLPDLPTLDDDDEDGRPHPPSPLRAFPVGQYVDNTFIVIEKSEWHS